MKKKVEPKVLIVDDSPAHIEFLGGILVADYDILVASNDVEALKIAQSDRPDIILLDVLMPGMDGYEICRCLKRDKNTEDIPVIFITTKRDVQDETKGFSIGAVDYITKPFSPPIVRARLKTQLSLRAAYQELQRKNLELAAAEALRMNVETFLSHDLQSPLHGIFGYAEFLLDSNPSTQQVHKYGQYIRDRAVWLLHMLKESSNLMKMEEGAYQLNLKEFDLLQIIQLVVSDSKKSIQKKRITLAILLRDRAVSEADQFCVQGEKSLCYTMLSNLIGNALDASPVDSPVTISLRDNGSMVSVAIHNDGAVPVEIREDFFNKYVTLGKKSGTGIGTYSAKWMAETQKGSIQMTTSDVDGTTVTFKLLKGRCRLENPDC